MAALLSATGFFYDWFKISSAYEVSSTQTDRAECLGFLNYTAWLAHKRIVE